jgi:DNA-binding response OmpR family regulator
MKVVIIHNDPTIVGDLAAALQARGHRTTVFTAPNDGWDYLKARPDDDALVTRVDFGPDSVNGLALAHVARAQTSPRMILFVGLPQWKTAARELGEFLDLRTPIAAIVEFLEEKARPNAALPSDPLNQP